MKKLICFLLAIVMTVSLAIPVFAEESEEPQYGTIKVEYSDARGTIENLDVMVFNGFIYTNVDSFCSRMGYVLEPGESMVDIRAFSDLWMDNAATLVLKFCINDTTVYYTPNCGISIEYTAPTPCIQNERGIWVPLSYTLNLLGGSRNIIGDVLVIQMPSPSILSVATVIAHNISLLSFDWVDDFGYDEKTVSKTDGASRVVTLFSGLLEFDGRAWSSFVDWDAFDKKFGKTLAAMMCTQSEAELKEYIEDVEGMLDVFSPKGAIGSSLHVQQAMIDSDVNAWAKICEEKLAQLKSGCGTLPQYNMAYQQYERATKKQDLFSAVGGNDFVYIQDGLAEAANALEWATRIGYGVTYLTEFQKRDDFQSTVLTDYFATRRKTEELADGTAQAIENYASSGLVEYSLRRFLEEHALEIFVDESGLDALMGVPANLLLLAWDIMSENIPFYSDGLKSVEAREISNYAQQVQTDAFLNLNDLLDSMRASPNSITYADAFQLAEYCYVYLKSCYIARSSAIESLKGISEEAQKKLQSKINVETDINRYIADYLAILGQADLDNSCYILGFLPKNNEELLNMYSDADLLTIVRDPEKQLTQINEYDGAGNLQGKMCIYYNGIGQKTSVVRDDIDYGRKSTDTYVYDDKGRLIEYHLSGGEYSEFYTYNSSNQLIEADMTYGWEWYEYDSQGRLSTIKGSFNDDYITTNHYDDSGKLIYATTEYTEYEGNTYSETTTYEYDSNNRLVLETSENDYLHTSHHYDYAFANLVLCEYAINDERSEVTANYTDAYGNNVELSFRNPQFYADSDGYLAKVVDTYTTNGKAQTTIYEFYYDGEIAVPQSNPISTTIALEEVQEHTYDDVEDLLYAYLAEEYGTEGLEVWHQSGNKFQMTISGNPGPIYVINWYLVDMDTGIVRNEETYTVICDLW